MAKTSQEELMKRLNGIGKFGGARYIQDDVDSFIPKEEENNVRILPPLKDGEFYGKFIHVHFSIGLDEDHFLCLHKNFGLPCPICEFQKSLSEDGADDDIVKLYFPKTRVLFNVLDLNNPASGVLVWDCPPSLCDEILLGSKSGGEVLDVSDPDEGYDISFVRKGKGKKTKYKGVNISREKTAIEDQSCLDELNDLEEILVEPDIEKIKSAIGALTSVDTTGTDTDKKEKKEEKKEEKKKDKKEKKESEKKEMTMKEKIQESMKKSGAK